MEGSQSSGVSNTGATRKRRSSILKSQRPPRTPFSELEFNVATPTDAAKSRRVSFSRKTGVAEFATNEATTTWKNFYEEQNKSLESSGHEDRPRPSVLGNRIFDQQFQEVEAEIDFNYAPNPLGLNTSLNNVNITHQINMLELEDAKLPAPHNTFELSAFTETNSKILNEITNPTLGTDSGRIEINFSNLNTIGGKDDLDEIDRDLENSRPIIVGPNFGEVSQYIEFDLNSTQGPLRGNESDMSITETIISPKKEVSKSLSFDRVVIDKENIVVNPYVSPAETDNFAINDETSQVLVFDGKTLKYADINADLDEVVQDVISTKPKRQTILESNDISMTQCIQNPQIRNISVFRVDMSDSQAVPNQVISETENVIPTLKRQTIVFNDLEADISMTQAIPANILSRSSIKPNIETAEIVPKRQTIVFANDDLEGDISVTQAVPANIFSQNSVKTEIVPKRQTIVFANDDLEADISITQAIPANILSRSSIRPNIETSEIVPKRQTIVFANDDLEGDISVTQAVPASILSQNSIKPEIVPKRQTIVFANEDLEADISMTQAIPANILSRQSIKPEMETKEIVPKRQTIVFTNDDLEGDISVTQAVPANILSRNSIKPEIVPRRQTILYDENNVDADISVTQAVPSNILSRQSIKQDIGAAEIVTKRQTIVFNNDDLEGDISVTQAVPANILSRNSIKPEIVPRRQTILYDENNVDADISVTQAVPSNILSRQSIKQDIGGAEIVTKRQTIVFNNDDLEADILVTQAVPANILSRNSIKPGIVPRRQTILYDENNVDADISVTQAVPSNILSRQSIKQDIGAAEIVTKRQTIVFNNDDLEADISVTQAVPDNILSRNSIKPEIGSTEVVPKRQTILFSNDDLEADVSMTQAIPSGILSKVCIKPNGTIAVNETKDIIAKRQTIVFSDDADVSVTQAIPTNILSINSTKLTEVEPIEMLLKRETSVFANVDLEADISMTEAIPANILSRISTKPEQIETAEMSSKRHTIDNSTDDRNTDISMTQAVPSDILRHSLALIVDKHQSKSFAQINDESNSMQTESITDEVQPKNEVILFDTNSVSSTQSKTETNKEDIDLDRNKENTRQPTLVYTLTTSIDQENNLAVPSSKGDDFHASSQKLDQDIHVLDNPQTASHSYRAPKVIKKRAEQVESKFEAAINSISYDTMVVSSTKIMATDSNDDTNLKVPDTEGQNEVNGSDTDSGHKDAEVKSSETSNKDTMSYQESNPSRSLSKSDVESRKSVLNELLDMSSMPDGFEDKEVTAKPCEEKVALNATEYDLVSIKDSKRSMQEEISNNSMFLIMRDSEDQLPKDNIKYFEDHRATDTQGLRPDEFLEQKLDQLLQRNESRKSILKDLNETKNKSIIDVNKSIIDVNKSKIDMNKSKVDAKYVNKSRMDVSQKTFKDADDTRELLEILSNLTDKTVCKEKSPRKSVGVSKSEQTKRLTFALDVETSSNERLTEALSRHSELEEYEETPAQITKKPLRLSQEVIKTLKFDDDDAKTPLKKTAFGETSYMTDKSKVIPSFISDADGIKELMDDLVKPMADVVVPLTNKVDKSVYKSNSTCSLQIQTNLITSSQIDFELCSTVSNYDVTNIADEGVQSISRALRSPVCPISEPVSAKSSMFNAEEKLKTESSKILIFDQNNPLNNIMLAPTEFNHSHKYNPDVDVERVTVKFDKDLPNIEEEISRVLSEKSVKVTEVADTEVNTVIAMKQNKELLEDASSLTLIENSDTEMDVDDFKVNPSSVQVIYKLDEIVLDEDVKRKRSYSPTKVMDSDSSIEVTPKPLSKVQRISHSPISVSITRKSPERKRSPDKSINSESPGIKSPTRNRLSPTRKSKENRLSPTRNPVETSLSPTRRLIEKLSPTKSENRASVARKSADLYNKTNTIVTVQRLATEYEREKRPDSFTSSNYVIKDATSLQSSGSRSDSIRSKSYTIGDSETSTNVVAKIDMMPCMGTKLCEWATTNTVDCMSFHFLHSRVRVVFRLAHRHDNAARSHVRADTRVVQATATAQHNEPSPSNVSKVIACLGVNFAADTMRFLMQGVARAGDIPDVVRRCALVADQAQRWARCMLAAHAQIALSVTPDGRIAYKVVNFPLKSVWQVSMRVSIEKNANGLPCPLASEVSVASVVGAEPPDAPKGLETVNGGWGHAVHTVWKIFKHLKNLREGTKTTS